MPYSLRYGDVWFDAHHVADGTSLMAVLIDANPDAPTLLKHGRADRMRTALARTQASGLYTHLEILYFPIHADIIGALNACVDNPARAGVFTQFLGEFLQAHPTIHQAMLTQASLA